MHPRKARENEVEAEVSSKTKKEQKDKIQARVFWVNLTDKQMRTKAVNKGFGATATSAMNHLGRV